MICWVKHFGTLIYVAGAMGITACQDNGPSIEASDTSTKQSTEIPLAEPINCRAILEAKTFESKRHGDQLRLMFFIQRNTNFNEALGDACEGDMKNLWQDFKRFSPLIEEHAQNLSHISGPLGYNLDYFPVTRAEIKRYVDEAATETLLAEKLALYDRSTLEGGMEIQRASRKFLMKTLQTYLEQAHKPIIESALTNNISLDEYGGEKLQYCNNSFNRCEYLPPNKTIKNQFNFEFIGVGIDGWTFKQDTDNKSE